MKKVCICLLLLLPFYSQPVKAQPSILLNVPINTQDGWETCWAAISLSILQYYGINNLKKWTIRWWANGGIDGVVCLYQAPSGCPGHAVDQILSHFGNISTSPFDNSISFDDTKTLLSNDKPLIFRWEYTDGSGHFLIIKGYIGNLVYYIDPLYNTIQENGYDWIVESSQHSWTHTLRINTAPPFSSIVGNLGTIGRALPVITIINSLLLKPKH